MGILDDLKQQAESLKQQQESGRAARIQNLQAIQPGLWEASRYLGDLANALNVIKPQVYRSFYVDMANKLDQLAQCDYMVRDKRRTLDNKDYLEEVVFGFRSVGNQNLTIEKDSPEGVKRLRDYLWAYNFRFECREFKTAQGLVERGTFTVFAELPATATFAGDWDSGKIKLTLKNIDKTGDVDYLYDASETNLTLLDELAKFLLGKPNNLRHLGSHQKMIRSTQHLLAAPEDNQPQDSPPLASEPEHKGGVLGFVKSLLKR